MTAMAALPRERRLFPRKDAAYYLGISLRSLDQLAHDGDIPKTNLAGRVVYDRVDLDRYVDRAKRAS